MHQDTIILAGGGTGGHVFPMIAVADELQRLAPDLRIVFVGTERGIENQAVPERGYELELVRIDPIRGRGALGALRGVGTATGAIPEALRLVKRLRPKVIFSLGGYAAGSVSVAARLKGIPLALMEPNSVIGLTNRVVAPFVARAYTAFPEVEKHFRSGAVMRSGVAIRRGFEPQPYGYDGGPLRVLVLGGSQGAKSLNETLPRALARAQTQLLVTHQAGKGHDAALRALYQQLGADEHLQVVPFIGDMAGAIRDCDLVVGRCGASAVAEVCAVGRPGIFIPFPYASGDHQRLNAMSLVRSGAAVCVPSEEATAERLTAEIDALAGDPPVLRRMAEASQHLGKPDSAEAVAVDLLELGAIPHDEAEDPEKFGSAKAATPHPSEVH